MDGCWHIWTDAGKRKTARVGASSWSAAATQWIVCQVSHTHRALCTAIKIRLIKFNTQLWASSLHGNTNTMGMSTVVKAFISVAIALSHYNMSVSSLPKKKLTLQKTQLSKCNSCIFLVHFMQMMCLMHLSNWQSHVRKRRNEILKMRSKPTIVEARLWYSLQFSIYTTGQQLERMRHSRNRDWNKNAKNLAFQSIRGCYLLLGKASKLKKCF